MEAKGSERRINKKLLSYWNSLKATDSSVPAEKMINPDEISEIWDNCFIIDVKKSEYSHIGKNLVAVRDGKSLIGRDIYDSLLSIEKSNIKSIVEEVVKTKAPIINESQLYNKYDVAVKYRRCVLPLVNDKGEVSSVLGGVRWKS